MPDEKEPTGGRKRKGKERAASGSRAFVVWNGMFLAVILLSYWVGWRSPWAMADQMVRVEVVDPPRPASAAAPSVSSPSDRRDESEDEERPRRRRSRSRARSGDSE